MPFWKEHQDLKHRVEEGRITDEYSHCYQTGRV